MATYIPDGYTREDGYVKGSEPHEETGEREYDGVAFSYRVATRVEVMQLDHDINQLFDDETIKKLSGVDGSEKLGCEWLAKRVTKWDLVAPDGTSVPITAGTFTRVHPGLFRHIYNIVRNQRLSDKKPDAKEKPPTTEEMQKN